jgi:hypothetical protein
LTFLSGQRVTINGAGEIVDWVEENVFDTWDMCIGKIDTIQVPWRGYASCASLILFITFAC